MAGTAITTGIALAGKAIGGIVNRHANRKAEKILQQQKQNNRSIFDRAYYEDALQRSENQHALTKTAELLRDSYNNAKGRQAIMGGTTDSLTATRAANADAIAKTTGQMAASASDKRDSALRTYESNNNAYLAQDIANQQRRAKNTVEAVDAMSATAKNIANVIAGVEANKEDEEDEEKEEKE